MKNIWFNEDNAHFYCDHPAEEMTDAGCRALVNKYADGGGIEGLLFCANVNRALFDSQVWEPLYVDYDPDGPDDQPALAWLKPEEQKYALDTRGRVWVHNLWLLKERGVDHLAVWLDQCQKREIQGWLTFRFNDCHHADTEDAFWHSSFWRDHPEYRRISYRDEGWIEGAYDFSHPEVVEHHFALIKELCERYDFDGLEIDFVRWVKHFSVGGEAAGAAILTDFLRRTRAELDKAETRTGRKIELGVRVPSDLRASLGWGYDVLTWAREELVDQIALGSFLSHAQWEWDIAIWRTLFGPKVRLLAQPESAMRPFPSSPPIFDYGLLWGGAASALHQGADGVYLFNECYRESPIDKLNREWDNIFDKLIRRTGDLETLRDGARRQVVSYPQISPQGEAPRASLPVSFAKPDAYDLDRFRQTITLRLPLGPKPQTASVELILGADCALDAATADEFQVWFNGQELTPSWVGRPENLILPTNIRSILRADVPPEALLEGINMVEVLPPSIEANFVWAELRVVPSD